MKSVRCGCFVFFPSLSKNSLTKNCLQRKKRFCRYVTFVKCYVTELSHFDKTKSLRIAPAISQQPTGLRKVRCDADISSSCRHPTTVLLCSFRRSPAPRGDGQGFASHRLHSTLLAVGSTLSPKATTLERRDTVLMRGFCYIRYIFAEVLKKMGGISCFFS